MEQNHITIDNVSNQNIEDILMNLANLYSDTGYTNGIQLYRKQNSTSSFLVLFTNSPDLERFNYFVNYIRYSEGMDNYTPIVRGYFQTKDINNNKDFSVGDWIMVYVSSNDKEYDNVNIVNSNNENYLYDFGGKIKKLITIEEQFEFSQLDLINYNHILDIYPSKSFESSTKPWWKFW
jgi:hypothetical protein